VCVVDPAVASNVQDTCETLQIKPTHILNTHHHWDHTDGNEALVSAYQCEVIGNKADASRISNISQPIQVEKTITIGSMNIQVLDVPGHTLGHIAFVIDDALFCGDALFGAGCGRIFEGSFEQMWDSLQKLAALDSKTQVYCAHEYTLPNLRFAREIDTDNADLTQRIQVATKTRMNKQPTIPSNIGLEKKTNPFLRPLDTNFLTNFNQHNNSMFDAFSAFKSIRERKNKW
jgi:hydroxyacylglutathione hydrolase